MLAMPRKYLERTERVPDLDDEVLLLAGLEVLGAFVVFVAVDDLVEVLAEDFEDAEEAVEEALNAYRDMNVNDTMQYPMNVGKVQASRVRVCKELY